MDYEQMNNNIVTIAGVIDSEPKYSHSVLGESFYEFIIKVIRLSNCFDYIPITISERLILEHNLKIGEMFLGIGQFRSYNKLENNKSKLILTVFIREVSEYDENINPNMIEIDGYICKEPIYRVTPFKREICDILIAVNRSYNKSDYLPCIAWGRNARFIKNFKVGERIKVIGRIQSREYQKRIDESNSIVKTAYEVSLSKIIVVNDGRNELEVEKVQTSMGVVENYYAN